MKHAIVASLLAVVMAAGAFAEDKPKPGAGKPGAGKRPGKPGEGGPGQMLAKLFEKADANTDGKMSLEEFKKAAENAPGGKLKDNADKIFTRLDGDGDGFVTKEEMKKGSEQFQNRKPGEKKPGAKKPGEKKPS